MEGFLESWRKQLSFLRERQFANQTVYYIFNYIYMLLFLILVIIIIIKDISWEYASQKRLDVANWLQKKRINANVKTVNYYAFAKIDCHLHKHSQTYF